MANIIKYAEMVLLVVVILLFIFFVEKHDWVPKPLYPSMKGKILLFLCGIAAALVALAIHEGGHLLAGLYYGFLLHLFVVGPFGVKRKDDKLFLYWNKELSHYGGITVVLPQADTKNIASNFGKVLLAGPCFSLIFAFCGLLLSTVVNTPFQSFFAFLGIVSFGIFIATTIPSKTGLFYTDRKRYQLLMTPGSSREIELALIRISSNYAIDMSYNNVKIADASLLMSADNTFYRYFGYVVYLILCKNQRLPVAEKVKIEFINISNTIPKNIRNLMEQDLNL